MMKVVAGCGGGLPGISARTGCEGRATKVEGVHASVLVEIERGSRRVNAFMVVLMVVMVVLRRQQMLSWHQSVQVGVGVAVGAEVAGLHFDRTVVARQVSFEGSRAVHAAPALYLSSIRHNKK